MGSNMAYELTNTDLGMERAIGYHLQGNHYPPVPLTMVQPCLDAIQAYWEDDLNRMIDMPEGVSYRGSNEAPAWAVIEQHHLDAWISHDED